MYASSPTASRRGGSDIRVTSIILEAHIDTAAAQSIIALDALSGLRTVVDA